MKLFLIKADNGKEATLNLPVNRHGGITKKGFEMIHNRFNSSLKYALMLEAFTTGDSLIEAITRYQKNII